KFSLSQDDRELDFNQISALFGELAREGTLNLIFTGGEAMLRDDFFRIARLAKDKNFAVTLFSNGQLIDEDNADRLAGIMPVCVYFSLYGADAFTHDKITGINGSFENLMRAVSLLRERRINVGFKTVVMRENLDQLREIFDLGKKMRIEKHDFGEEITGKIDGSCGPKRYQIDEGSLFDYYKGDIPQPNDRIEELPQAESLQKPLCGAGVFGACVSCYGDVYPCAEWRAPLGNIKYTPFKEIWHRNAGLLGELRSVKEYKDLADCRRCSLVNFCRRCPGRAFFEEKDWHSCYQGAYKRAAIKQRINAVLAEGR
ncbi:MAG: radical SAM protein, partial [Candidatus Omnitrophica bacterium]|nr:radical SAM protein [Candidatus Omnitrophota bacterium]